MNRMILVLTWSEYLTVLLSLEHQNVIGIKASLGPERDANGATSPPFSCLVFIEISFYDFQYKI